MLKCFAKGLPPHGILVNIGIDNVKSTKIEHIRVYIRSVEERGEFEISAAKTPVNYPERRSNFAIKDEIRTLNFI